MSKLMDLMDAWLDAKEGITRNQVVGDDLIDFEFEIIKVPPVKEITCDFYMQALAEKKIKEAEEMLFREVNPIEKIDWDRVRKNRKYQFEESSL